MIAPSGNRSPSSRSHATWPSNRCRAGRRSKCRTPASYAHVRARGPISSMGSASRGRSGGCSPPRRRLVGPAHEPQTVQADASLTVSISNMSDSCCLLQLGDSNGTCLLVQCTCCSLKTFLVVWGGAQSGKLIGIHCRQVSSDHTLGVLDRAYREEPGFGLLHLFTSSVHGICAR
jgi:hypothetical protein